MNKTHKSRLNNFKYKKWHKFYTPHKTQNNIPKHNIFGAMILKNAKLYDKQNDPFVGRLMDGF